METARDSTVCKLPIEVLHCGTRDFRRFFCSCDLGLARWPSHTNLTVSQRCLWSK